MNESVRELLGRAVRDAWVARQRIAHPERGYQDWHSLTEFERETDRLIGDAVATERRRIEMEWATMGKKS